MARDYAKVWLRITEDADFRALTRGPQHLYLMLLLSRTVNSAGVADWRPKRMSVIAHGWTEQQIEADAAALESGRFIVVDRASEEVLLRSFVRHDGVMAGPKTAQGMASAYRRIASLTVRASVLNELVRLRQELPDSKAWEVPDVAEILRPVVDPEYPGSIPGVSEGVSEGVSRKYPDGMPQVSPSSIPLTSKPLLQSAGAPKPRRKPETVMPDDWSPKPIHHEHAKPGVDIAAEEQRFRVWVEANDRRYRNWDAGFSNWLLNARPQQSQRAGPQRSTTDDRVQAAFDVAAEFEREEQTHRRQIGR